MVSSRRRHCDRILAVNNGEVVKCSTRTRYPLELHTSQKERQCRIRHPDTGKRISRPHLHILRSRSDIIRFVILFVISPWDLSSLKGVHSAGASAAMCLARSNRIKTNLTLSLIDTWNMTHNDTETAERTRSGREYAREARTASHRRRQ